MSELGESLKTLKSEIAEMNVQIKRAGEDRELENKDFQATVTDQRETQTLLNKAINVLKAVYTKQAVGKKANLARHTNPEPLLYIHAWVLLRIATTQNACYKSNIYSQSMIILQL